MGAGGGGGNQKYTKHDIMALARNTEHHVINQ